MPLLPSGDQGAQSPGAQICTSLGLLRAPLGTQEDTTHLSMPHNLCPREVRKTGRGERASGASSVPSEQLLSPSGSSRQGASHERNLPLLPEARPARSYPGLQRRGLQCRNGPRT